MSRRWSSLENRGQLSSSTLICGTVDGYFFALDAESGMELWRMALGARVHSTPMTYSVNGAQFVTIAAGNVVFTFGLD